LPLSERARVEVYLPDLPRQSYRDLLDAFEQEFTYTFGGCTTVRGVDGIYLSRAGLPIRDRINIVCTDTPFEMDEHLETLSLYTDQLREAAMEALEEEAIPVAVAKIHHSV
jgi:hypothetical protein